MEAHLTSEDYIDLSDNPIAKIILKQIIYLVYIFSKRSLFCVLFKLHRVFIFIYIENTD